MLQLSTYHQRTGGYKKEYIKDKQMQVRIYESYQNNNGKSRFDYKQAITGLQWNTNLYENTNSAYMTSRSGIIFDYSYANTRFFDELNLDMQDKKTGRMHAQSIAMGGYYTKTTAKSSYLDIVGIISLLNNDFKDSYGEKSSQTGWRTGISAETGITVLNGNRWGIESQIQLVYQYTDYNSFNDSYSHIDGYCTDMLRGRGGFRIFKNFKEDKSQVYGIANIIHDFMEAKEQDIDEISVREKYDKTYGETGLGFNINITEKSSIYGDIRYQKSFDGNMENGIFNIGFKTNF